MKISDELRQWSDESDSGDGACDELRDLADRMDNEMVELPKDNAGKPIHIRDTVYTPRGSKAFVIGIRFFEHMTYVKVRTSKAEEDLEFCPTYIFHTRPDSLERIADELEDWSEDNRANWSSDVFDRAAEFAHRVRKLAKKEDENAD